MKRKQKLSLLIMLIVPAIMLFIGYVIVEKAIASNVSNANLIADLFAANKSSPMAVNIADAAKIVAPLAAKPPIPMPAFPVMARMKTATTDGAFAASMAAMNQALDVLAATIVRMQMENSLTIPRK